ncbi:MAG: hypothetical protein QM811_27430 [Pirellulales bacterium]
MVTGTPQPPPGAYTNYGIAQSATRTATTAGPFRSASTGGTAPNTLPAGWPGAQPNAIPNAGEAPVSVRNLGDLPRVDGR